MIAKISKRASVLNLVFLVPLILIGFSIYCPHQSEAFPTTDSPRSLPNKDTLKIAFGSCLKDSATPIWGKIAEKNPDLFLFMGDNIYFDDEHFNNRKESEAYMISHFSKPGIRKFLKEVPHLAIWDDHDYGPNNSDSTYPGRLISLGLFRKFWKPAPPPKALSESIVQAVENDDVLLLLTDNRTYRKNAEVFGDNGAFYGAKQIDWIRNKVASRNKGTVIIATGGQILTDGRSQESLQEYPKEASAIRDIISKSKVDLVFLGGDLHFSRISKHNIEGRDVLEAISSPLNARIAYHRVPVVIPDNTKIYARGSNFGMLTLERGGVSKIEIYNEEGELRISY